MWSLQVYTRKKRAGQRLNLTPTPDQGPTAKAEPPPGGKRLKGKMHRLQKISEKAECSGRGGGGPRPRRCVAASARPGPSASSKLTSSFSESVPDDLQVDSSSSNSELISGLTSQHISSSFPSYSLTDSYTEYKSFEESLSSFPSPELFRGSDYLDWECPKLEEHMRCKNSTLLDTSKAVAIEKVPQFSNLSAILGEFSQSFFLIAMTLADQNISPKPKNTSHSESDNAACEVLLAEKTYPSAPEKTKKKRTNSSTPGKKSRGLLTSTPSSKTAGLVIDLSSVQKASFEELLPNVSNYVNSNEIVPVSNLQENSSNEFPSNTSEMCCIIRATPGTRQVKSKDVIVKKKKYSPPKDIPQAYAID
uniref:Meiotic kinetochore factor n=1 Tax=Canis lupus dingo TaxID=286419 RepID=A0A8C0KL40_CANLU